MTMRDATCWAALREQARQEVRRRAKQQGRPVRLGLLVPWANVAVETEVPLLLAEPEWVSWHFARLMPASRTTALDDEFLIGMVDAVPHALEQLSHLRLSGVGFACTAAAFRHHARLEQRVGQATLDLQVISAFQAICFVLTWLGVSSVTLITPYTTAVSVSEAHALTAAGFEVIDLVTLGLDDGFDQVQAERLVQARLSVQNDSDITVISCTGLHTLRAIQTLEEHRIGAVSSNSCLTAALALQAAEGNRDASSGKRVDRGPQSPLLG
jgi:maleate isomerase